MKMKIITLLSLCITALSVNAQIRLDPFYPYSKWTVGAGVGFSEIYGNLNNSNSEPMFRLNVERNANAWTYFGLQFQHGALSDYETKNHWTNGLNVYNQISTFDLNIKMSIGQIFKYPPNFFCKTIFGIYVGVGAGYMFNDVSNITTKFTKQSKYLITDYNSGNIKTRTQNFFIPFSLGWNIHMTKRCVFNVNYQFSYAFSDYLDGYDFPQPTAKNYYNDMFSVLTFGLNFYVGHVGSLKNVRRQ